MLGKRRWLSVALVAAVATFGFGLSAGADSATEGAFLAEINASRAANGLGALSVDGSLRSHARSHTQQMMDANKIFHSSSAELQAAAPAGWEKLGENVGRGGNVQTLHQAFMDSSGHQANILGDYNKVGIGAATKDGVLYVTVVFMKIGSSETTTTTTPATTTAPPTAPTTTTSGSTATTSKPAPATTPAPVQSTTTTTLAPATTTTLIVGPDKPVTPGQSCIEATRFWWTCHD